MPDIELVVTQPHGDRQIGDVITDQGEIDAALEASPHCVVKRAKAVPPAPPQAAPIKPAE